MDAGGGECQEAGHMAAAHIRGLIRKDCVWATVDCLLLETWQKHSHFGDQETFKLACAP